MAPHPTRIALTTTEAKKLYKQNSAQLPDNQRRVLERSAELEARAARIRDQDRKRKIAREKRELQEKRAEAARKEMRIGLATQLIGFNHTQAQLKRGMEAFLGLKKTKEEVKRKETEVVDQLDAIAEALEKEPWDEDESLDPPGLDMQKPDQFIDDDLDDDTMLEAHNLVFSDPIEEPTESPTKPRAVPEIARDSPQAFATVDEKNNSMQQPVDAAKSCSIGCDNISQESDDLFSTPQEFLEHVQAAEPNPEAKMDTSSRTKTTNENREYIQVHGPVDKSIEAILEKLPDPLVELLSQDTSTTSNWDPAPAFLHKLNPIGLPPHRLRLKVGCTVVLLRDLGPRHSSQVLKTQRLQLLRAEKDWLECVILDGPLKGTKQFLTRLSFPVKHRDDDQRSYQRLQFPIRVSAHDPPVSLGNTTQSSFKLPKTINGRSQSTSTAQKRPVPAAKPKVATSSKANSNSNPSFKLPGLPASKKKAPAPPNPPIPTCDLDGWDDFDFLDSGTQIARELSQEDSKPAPLTTKAQSCPPESMTGTIFPLSTQDFDFDFNLEDLDESVTQPIPTKAPQETTLPINQAATPFMPPRKPAQNSGKTPPQATMTPPVAPPQRPPPLANAKRKLPLPPSNDPPPAKRKVTPPPIKPSDASLSNSSDSSTAYPSFHDFGLSTQEAVSFFDDDDDLTFGSPPITV